MKTCLYNPVFINPLAYFVFPQLYAMQPKTDDLVEYAKYTGQLIVTDVTDKDTYIVYSRSNSIDLSDFAEKRIRISLYTNTGAVLLGEWNMPEGGLPKPIAAWSAAGKTNLDEDRAILKDLTGNGHDITLNGFAFSKMSGYGGYKIKDNYWTTQKIEDGSYINTKTSISYIPSEDGTQVYNNGTFLNEGDVVSVKITGIPKGGIVQFGYSETIWIIADKDGIYKGSYMRNANNTCDIRTTNCVGSRITIEWLPEYPDALVFDGVNDYGICENLPKLNDYTFICKRIVFDGSKGAVASKAASNLEGAFVFEGGTDFTSNIYSFGMANNTPNTNSSISYQTKNSYNGIKINTGDVDDTNYINIGGFRWASMAFYSAYLFDRSLTEEEIKVFIRKNIDPSYLLPSEIPTPDCYYDFTNGDNTATDVATIKDLSGNGNNAIAYNFAWNEEGSGYKNGALYFDGVDDYIALEAFDSGFKTVFMLCNPFKAGIIYDQRPNDWSEKFGIYIGAGAIAYSKENMNDTYINNINNKTLLDTKFYNKKHLIHIVANDISNSRQPNIGRSVGTNLNINAAIYKFLGFKEALNEDQIKAIIQKYNLLDGVDDIKVS